MNSRFHRAILPIARAQGGYFTAQQAAGAQVNAQAIRYHLAEGSLERPVRGVYRLVSMPEADHHDLIPFYLWGKEEGFISHATALELYELTDAWTSEVQMTFPSSWRRRRFPDGIRPFFSRAVETWRGEWFGSVRAVEPHVAINQCAQDGLLDADAISRALEEGLARKLFAVKRVAPAFLVLADAEAEL